MQGFHFFFSEKCRCWDKANMVEIPGWDCCKFKEDWIFQKRELGIRVISNRKYGHVVHSASYTQEKPSTSVGTLWLLA